MNVVTLKSMVALLIAVAQKQWKSDTEDIKRTD